MFFKSSVFGELEHFIALKLSSESLYLISWNLAVLVYLGMTFYMIWRTRHGQIKRRTKNEYERKRIMLITTILSSINCVVAVVRELGSSEHWNDAQIGFHIGLAMTTVILSWFFIHTLFALYYAHYYYHAEHDDDFPLDFPHESNPDYYDFLYFSYGIGVSGQASDVAFTTKVMRRIGTVHSVLSFFYNTAILALMIEMAASFLG
ncbi:DUF1345 domain-containing protein [Moraxella macacae]|nr:DUF1345 domain-containing protein [Moraxella macacae]